MADTELNLTFTPRVDGREIAGVTVNVEAIAEDSFDVAEYVYSAVMPNADTTIELGFTVVDKQNLRAAIEIAEGRADEAAEAVPSVKEKYEAALQAAKDVEAKKTATQDEINTAWSDLIDALHYLSFVAGDKSQLDIPMEIADSINRDLFTPDSLDALDEAYAAAEDCWTMKKSWKRTSPQRWMRCMTPFMAWSTAQTSPSWKRWSSRATALLQMRISTSRTTHGRALRPLWKRQKPSWQMKTQRRMRWIPQ